MAIVQQPYNNNNILTGTWSTQHIQHTSGVGKIHRKELNCGGNRIQKHLFYFHSLFACVSVTSNVNFVYVRYFFDTFLSRFNFKEKFVKFEINLFLLYFFSLDQKKSTVERAGLFRNCRQIEQTKKSIFGIESGRRSMFANC